MSIDSDAFSKDCILQYLAVTGVGVTLGDLVYYDTSAACYKPAKALFISDSITGLLYPTERCNILGMLIATTTTDNSYILLRQGYFKDSLIQSTLGNGAVAGIYYLSLSNSGKATNTPSLNIKIPCISYYGNNTFSIVPSHYVKIGKSQTVLKLLRSDTLIISDSLPGILRILQPIKIKKKYSSALSAVVDLTNDELFYAPVVSKLLPGAGILITDLLAGRWMISAKTAVNTKLTATDFTLNGTQRAADSLLTYTVFPAGATTSMIMTMPIGFILDSNSFSGQVKVWMTTRGPGTATYNISIYWLPYTASTQVPTDTNYTGTIVAQNSSTTVLSLVLTAPIDVHFIGAGVLIARILTTNTSNNDCYVHQAGFLLTQAVSLLLIESDAAVAVPMTEQDVRDIVAQILKWNPGNDLAITQDDLN